MNHQDMMIPHNHDRLSVPSFVHAQEHITPNPNPNSKPASTSTAKKKRNLPGNPDPDAEVIALSPKSLMATNRFFCEICSKGFQREQNLQLHKRGHNLPWKLKQRTNKSQVKKKVYICPEKSCVHHDPARALGDLTGIKKHFSRKHGEKKWKCDKCSKKYAVVSDWKAHSKICGSREFRCDCGTVFSRKDSFISHRTFCDVLAEESAKFFSVPSPKAANSTISIIADTNSPVFVQSQLDQSLTGTGTNLNINNNNTTLLRKNFTKSDSIPQQTNAFPLSPQPTPRGTSDSVHNLWKLREEEYSNQWLLNECMNNKNIIRKVVSTNQEDEIKKGNISSGSNSTDANIASLFSYNQEAGNQASLSATTLLQKVAQMGSSSSSDTSSMLGIMTSSIFNNRMPNSDGLKTKNKEKEWTRDFLGVKKP
ncbi:PREDICTED: protein indeterminate-domain 13-like [Camelina sativa]|uniref:Protein indeterminate-domain 13-like n=1 Tax=Camelina sativa TaxID=90675 RepID=A0ABM1R2A3_CAMSA|nr:PREDICTED: protein indeterminate-domain 13-like [Camelina sativa]